jgi:hypothetical protein
MPRFTRPAGRSARHAITPPLSNNCGKPAFRPGHRTWERHFVQAIFVPFNSSASACIEKTCAVAPWAGGKTAAENIFRLMHGVKNRASRTLVSPF